MKKQFCRYTFKLFSISYLCEFFYGSTKLTSQADVSFVKETAKLHLYIPAGTREGTLKTTLKGQLP